MSNHNFDVSGMTPVEIRGSKARGFKAYKFYEGGKEVARTCTKCREIFRISCFPVNSGSPLFTCRECTKDLSRQRASKVSTSSKVEVDLVRKTKYPLGTKSCKKCDKSKKLEDFPYYKNSSCRTHSWCWDCYRAYNKSRKAPPGYDAERGRARAKINAERAPEELLEDQKRIRPDGTKKCRTCKNTLNISMFHKGIMQDDGLYSSCKNCSNLKRTRRRKKIYETYWTNIGVALECYLCGGPYEEVEHVVPESLGGPDTPENTRPVCSKCNHGVGGKHGTPMEEFIYRSNHPTRARQDIIEALMVDGAWPFSVEYGSKEWEELDISRDPEFAHLFIK